MLPPQKVKICLECKTSKPSKEPGSAGWKRAHTQLHPTANSHRAPLCRFSSSVPFTTQCLPRDVPQIQYLFPDQQIHKKWEQSYRLPLHPPSASHTRPALSGSQFCSISSFGTPGPDPRIYSEYSGDWCGEAKAGGIIHKDKNVL